MVDENRILREDRDGLCILTMNRPEKLNALDPAMFVALEPHVADLETSTTIGCVVLKGAGRAFCAGVDLNALAGNRTRPGYSGEILERLSSLPQPVIASIHGACYTGALELALACDFMVADATARFADTHGKWGLVAGWGMTERLPRRIGLARAKRMTFTAQTLSAQQALEIGLVDELAAEGELEAVTEQFARAILANSWFSNAHHKAAMRRTDGVTVDEGLTIVKSTPGLRAPEFQERVRGFVKKG